MKKLIAVSLVALGCSCLLADEPREELKAIGSEPPRTSYEFRALGRSPVSCYGTSCAQYYAPIAANSGGAVLRLLRSDATIVIVQCKAHGEAQSPSPGSGSGDANKLQSVPNCMMPDAGYQIAADFNPREVTLTMFKPGADGPGPITSETYSIVGVLRPTLGQGDGPEPDAADSATKADGRLAQQTQLTPRATAAPAPGSEDNAESQAGKSKSRHSRRGTADDLQGSSQLLTYLTHELMDPNRMEAKKRLAAMGPVHAALSSEAEVSTPLQQEPQGIAPPPEQALMPQGTVDTAVTPPVPASTIAVSEPHSLASAPTAALLAQGSVDTPVAPAVAASTIAFSEPKALPEAATKAPLPHGQVDAGLAPVATASTIALPAPKGVSVAQATVPQGQSNTDMPQVRPVPTELVRTPEHAASAAPVPDLVQAPAEQSQVVPEVTRVAATAEPIAPQRPPADRQAESAAAPSIGAASEESSRGAAASVAVAVATVPPAPVPVPQEQAQVEPKAPAASAVMAQVPPPSAPTSRDPIQVAAVAAAPSMPAMASGVQEPAGATADAASAGVDPLMENPHLRKVEREIEDLDFPVQELAAQWAMFEKECPEPTTDAMCLDAKTKIIASMQKVFESKIQLLDQKIDLLETVPRNAMGQQEEDEAKDTREKMKVALDSFPKVLAHLNMTLEDLKREKDAQ